MSGDLGGTRLGRFKLLEMLGAGGMGVVYRAEDETLRREVAIKVLPQTLLVSPQQKQRFLREARAAAQLNHPGIAAVYEVGEQDGQTFIVMELVRGVTLGQRLAAERLSLAAAVEVVTQIARAVAQAHVSGVAHRDLKPDNVMLSASGPKILDFGIARQMLDDEETELRADPTFVTEEGRILGTPGYMAPEQAGGLRAGLPADVFALGVLLYEMATGARPFRGNTAMEVLFATVKEEPSPPSQLNPEVSAQLATIIRRCLEKRPEDRYPTATELLAALDSLDASSFRAPPMGPGGTHKMAVVPEPGSRAQLAVAPTVGLASNGDTAAAVAHTVADTLPRTSSTKGKLGVWLALGAVGLVAALTVPIAYVALSKEGLSTTASSRTSLVEPKVGLQTLEEYARPNRSDVSSLTSEATWLTARADFERAAAREGAPQRWKAAVSFTQAMALLARGELDAARRELDRALELDGKWALPHLGIATVHIREQSFSKAQAAARQAQLLEPELWLALVMSGRTYALEDKHELAITEYRRALRQVPERPFVLAELALVYHAAGMDVESKRVAEQALKLDPDLVSIHVMLAERALEESQGTKALAHAERAIGVEPTRVSAWLAKGDALLLLDRAADAKDAFEKALKLHDELKRRGAPEARLESVRAALKKGKLPAPRHVDIARAPRVSSAKPGQRSKPSPKLPPKPTPRTGPGAGSGPPKSQRSPPMGGADL